MSSTRVIFLLLLLTCATQNDPFDLLLVTQALHCLDIESLRVFSENVDGQFIEDDLMDTFDVVCRWKHHFNVMLSQTLDNTTIRDHREFRTEKTDLSSSNRCTCILGASRWIPFSVSSLWSRTRWHRWCEGKQDSERIWRSVVQRCDLEWICADLQRWLQHGTSTSIWADH